jgi:hypothetical protein
MQQLAAALQQLTGLQRLWIDKAALEPCFAGSAAGADAEAEQQHVVDGIEALAKVIGAHVALQEAYVKLLVQLSVPAAQDLRSKLKQVKRIARRNRLTFKSDLQEGFVDIDLIA